MVGLSDSGRSSGVGAFASGREGDGEDDGPALDLGVLIRPQWDNPIGCPVTAGRTSAAPEYGARRFENVSVVTKDVAPPRSPYSRSTATIETPSDSQPVVYPLP